MKIAPFIDYTPSCCTGIRGAEIYSWFYKNVDYAIRDQVKYVILDDDSDMLLWQKDHFFKTSFNTGLTEVIAQQVINYLNGVITEHSFEGKSNDFESWNECSKCGFKMTTGSSLGAITYSQEYFNSMEYLACKNNE